MTTRICKPFLLMVCAVSILALPACNTVSPNSCAGFTLNNLSPQGFSALVHVDRPGAERVAGNDRNFKRRGC